LRIAFCARPPDGHVAWRGNAMPDNATAIIDTVRGAEESTK